jgi:hypothetical protein
MNLCVVVRLYEALEGLYKARYDLLKDGLPFEGVQQSLDNPYINRWSVLWQVYDE